jgi:putative heme iron utilization protein
MKKLRYQKTKEKNMTQLTISQDIVISIENIANQFNLSVSELLEKISQGQLTIINSDELENLLDLRDAIEAENNPENQERIDWDVIKQNLSQ